MITLLSDNIISPLGVTTAQNLSAVRQGRSALTEHRHEGMPDAFVASLFEVPMRFEEGLIRTIEASLEEAQQKGVTIHPASQEVVFILSSTKGNVMDFERIGISAQRVADHFGNPNRPIVVSNACISGLSAQILAMRLLNAGHYRVAVVAGMDIQSKFIVSGFQSFKALSPDPCRPFDGDRCGLNLGEAAASIILMKQTNPAPADWKLKSGAIRNDAVHISNPSKTGEGSYRAMRQICREEDVPGCISAHGTATLYNDEMEAAAIDRSGFSELPTFSLKGYFGHTMGAAGILESIIALHAMEEGWIPATKGFEESGTRHQIHVTHGEEKPRNTDVLKLMSGFGGCNAALWYTKSSVVDNISLENEPGNLSSAFQVSLNPSNMPQGLTSFYRQHKAVWGDYPKFFKMDPLCKLGFLASELLLQEEAEQSGVTRFEPREDRAIVIFTRSGSMADDKAYMETISDPDNYFPSPAIFVYTLSNIVTGELALRNAYYGETSCFILEEPDEATMQQIIASSFQDDGIQSVLAGWLEYEDEQHFEADLRLYRKE
ncbi:MAG: 3-oxoacyl-ACP synthase [Bacteroidales bacterium]|nr:3-oxoacyl-ACP synthase [Bacteroidales bacterium]